MEFSAATEHEIRDRAVESLKRKRAFRTQIGLWAIVSALLIGIWAIAGAGFFWPVFPIGGWAIGLIAQGWSIYGPDSQPISEDEIARESERLRR
jgi:hypothetical protein